MRERWKRFWAEEKEYLYTRCAIAGLLAICGLLLVDVKFARLSYPANGVVIDRAYGAGGTSVGQGISSRGSSTVIVTNEPESYTLIVRCGGKVVSAYTDPESWSSAKAGAEVVVYERRGCIFGWLYCRRASQVSA